jgi:O-antigen/teichoic acid export membrane protein
MTGAIERARGWLPSPNNRERRSTSRSHGQLFRSAHALMLNTLLTGGSGFVFWLLAARLYAPSQVGVDGALISLMAAVSAMCQLNLGNIFPRFLPEATNPSRAIVLGYATAGTLSLVFGTIAILVVPHFSKNLEPLGANHALSVLWVLAVVLWTVFALQDSALTGLRYARWVPAENGAYGLMKIGGLVILAVVGAANGIFIAWVVPMMLLLVPVNLVIFRHAVHAHTPSGTDGIVSTYGRARFYRFFGLNYVASVLDQGMFAALPLVMVAVLGATQTAYYFIPFTIVTTLDALAYNMATSLTVEGAFASHRVHELAVAASRRFLLILLPVTLALVIAAPLVLLPFGRAYVEHGTVVLRIIAIASLFRAVVTLNDAVCRIRGRGVTLALFSATRCVGMLVLTVLLATAWGLAGAAIAWLVTQVAVASMAAPLLWRFFHAASAEEPNGSERPGGDANPGGQELVADDTAPADLPDGLPPAGAFGADFLMRHREATAESVQLGGLASPVQGSQGGPWPTLDRSTGPVK